MWINRQQYLSQQAMYREVRQDLLAEVNRLRAALAVSETKRQALEAALATSQNNVDWLRVEVNKLTLDRAAIAAAKGIELPAPILQGQVRTPEEVQRAAAAKDGPGLASLPDELDHAMDKFSGLANGFEDVGDEAADALGIRHSEDGAVEYVR